MEIVTLDSIRLVGIRVCCPGDQYEAEIAKAAVRLRRCAPDIQHRIAPERLVGAFVVGGQSEDEDGYWVCVEVSDFSALPDGLVAISVPAQRYASRRHEGPASGIRDAYLELHKWIQAMNLERIHQSWHIEIYDGWGESEEDGMCAVTLLDTIR